jgi:benzoate-CoA ligase family protein
MSLHSLSTATPGISDPCCEAAAEINFTIPAHYNASALLFDNLDRGRGSHLAVTGPGGSRTYEQLCGDAARYGLTLLDLGLTRGDRVLLFLDDTPAYPAAFFGALRAGLVPILINTLTPADLLNFYLKDSGAQVAIVDVSFADRLDDQACLGTELRCIIFTNGAAPATSPVRAMSEAEVTRHRSNDLPAADTHRDDMAFWQYSSGSTGRPKGIVHLQHDMVYTAMSYARHILQIGPGDICLSVPKIFFAYGLGNSLTFPFSVGATAVLLPGQPKPASIFEAISRYRPTLFFGLPTLYTALTKAPEARLADLSSLRMCLSAAEVLSNDVAELWRQVTAQEIIEGLGSTEVLHIYLSNTPCHRKTGAAGRPVPGYQVKLVDRNDREVEDGEEGILWVRGDSSAPCYWNSPDKTAETMRADGWIYTGDRMRRDADGHYFFLGRADDLVKVSGQWVYPLEVERCLAEHPLVRECAVLAIELADRRMTLKAFVVLNRDGPAEQAVTGTLQNYVKQTLLPYKYPRIVEFRDELPKTGTGKIDRQALLRSQVEPTA